MRSKYLSPSASIAPACVFGAACVGESEAARLIPGTDGRAFCFQADAAAGRVHLALEGGRLLSLRAGVRLQAGADGWLTACVPGSGAEALRVCKLVQLRAIGHDELQVSVLAQEFSDTIVWH